MEIEMQVTTHSSTPLVGVAHEASVAPNAEKPVSRTRRKGLEARNIPLSLHSPLCAKSSLCTFIVSSLLSPRVTAITALITAITSFRHRAHSAIITAHSLISGRGLAGMDRPEMDQQRRLAGETALAHNACIHQLERVRGRMRHKPLHPREGHLAPQTLEVSAGCLAADGGIGSSVGLRRSLVEVTAAHIALGCVWSQVEVHKLLPRHSHERIGDEEGREDLALGAVDDPHGRERVLGARLLGWIGGLIRCLCRSLLPVGSGDIAV